MSDSYQIITDGSCDLTPEMAREHDFKIVPFYVSFDQEHYFKEVEEVGIRDFYQQMVDHPDVFPKTSLPAIDDYITAFMPFVKEGKPVLCLCLTSKMSGSYNAACNARNIILDDHPNAQIAVIDSAVITGLQGLLVMETVRMRDNGLSYEETIAQIERIKETGRIVFTTADISYLKSGGRLGKLISIANNALKIKPLILFKEGEIFPTGVVRARKKSYDKLIEQTRKHFKESGKNPDDYDFSVGYGFDREEGELFRDYMLEDMKTYSGLKTLDTFQIGATIAVHTGPHPLGIVFLKRYDS